MRALLDVNVWVALFDDAHQFSDRANLFIEKKGVKIATCPLVENGVVRVMSSPHYSRRGAPAIQQVRARLGEACAAVLMQAGVSNPFRILGIPDEETVPGAQADIFRHYGISMEGLTETATILLK